MNGMGLRRGNGISSCFLLFERWSMFSEREFFVYFLVCQLFTAHEMYSFRVTFII